MGRSRYKITKPQQPHFITMTVLHWIPVFTRPDTVNILLDSLRFFSFPRSRVGMHTEFILVPTLLRGNAYGV